MRYWFLAAAAIAAVSAVLAFGYGENRIGFFDIGFIMAALFLAFIFRRQ